MIQVKPPPGGRGYAGAMKMISALLERLRSSDHGHVRLAEVMRRRRAFLPHPLTRTAQRDVELAVQRCVSCHSKKLCDELLEGQATDGFGSFCPNSHYIERLRQGALQFK